MSKSSDSGAILVEEQRLWNCKPKFKFECTQSWEALMPTKDPKVRHCSMCQQQVHICHSPDEFVQFGNRKQCVAIPENRTIAFAQEWTGPMLGRPDTEKLGEGEMARLYWWSLTNWWMHAKKIPRVFEPAIVAARNVLNLQKRPEFKLPPRKLPHELSKSASRWEIPTEIFVEWDPQFDVKTGWNEALPHFIPPLWTGLVMNSQYAFNTSGAVHQRLCNQIGYEQGEIRDIMDWANDECKEPTIVKVISKNSQNAVGAVVFVPGENARCYKRFVRSLKSAPHRDFFYGVAFEAYQLLCSAIPARGEDDSISCFATIGMSELSAGGGGAHKSIVKAQVEAFYHFTELRPEIPVDRLRFFGGVSESEFDSLAELLPTLKGTRHRPIETVKGHSQEFETITLR